MNVKFIDIIKQPYPLYLEFSKSFPVVIGIGILIPLFLFVFQPFDLTDETIKGRELFLIGFGVIVFMVLSLNVYGVTKIFRNIFDEENWTAGKEFLWILWNVFSCLTATAFYEFLQPDCPFSFYQLMSGYFKGFLVSIIPVGIMVAVAYTGHLRSKIRRAERAVQKLRSSDKEGQEITLELRSETGTEKVAVRLNSLLFIQSVDNYSNIVTHQEANLKKDLIRSSLKKLENQIKTPLVLRCHRSFIVNLLKVSSIEGNARGYKLLLNSYSEVIPVSRQAGKQVLKVLETLSCQ